MGNFILKSGLLITDKRAANVFADLYQEKSTTHVALERIKQVREETENIILPSYGEERDCSITDPFSMKEVKDSLKKVKTRKAPGPDGITGVMLKTSWSLLQSSTSGDFKPQLDEGGSTCSLDKWTMDWGLEMNIDKTNSTRFSLSTSKEQKKTTDEG